MDSQSIENRRTIPQVNSLVRSLVEQETFGYPFWVNGIISRYYVSDFGHTYFDLTDQDYTISCMLHERRRGTLNFELGNGLEVEVFGSIRVYDKLAKVQIDVEQARLISHDVFVVDENIQQQLARRGCWPPVRRPLPEKIQQIALITSKYSDAREDFFSTFNNQNGRAAITTHDVRVQGEQAPRQIAYAIERINRENSVDVIALVRGGGRVEELAAFNDVDLAAAIYKSAIPIITGIGHQQDDTLADQMADFKAITPTAAALELAKRAQAEPLPAAESQPKQSAPNLLLAAVVGLIILVVLVTLLQNAPA